MTTTPKPGEKMLELEPHPLVDFLSYQVILAQADVAEESLGEDHDTTQDLFWLLMDYPHAAEA
jgi:hypothetical protein